MASKKYFVWCNQKARSRDVMDFILTNARLFTSQLGDTTCVKEFSLELEEKVGSQKRTFVGICYNRKTGDLPVYLVFH